MNDRKKPTEEIKETYYNSEKTENQKNSNEKDNEENINEKEIYIIN